MTNYIAQAQQLGISIDDVAEWVGLHYGRNFESETMAKRSEWLERYAEAHAIKQADLSEAAPVNTLKDQETPKSPAKPLLLECSMVNERPELGVATKGYFITNPFYDVGMFDKVDPMECWGVSEAQAKLLVALNEELAKAVEDAINAGCSRLQKVAGITDGGYAGRHFSDSAIRNQMMQIFGGYIAAELNDSGFAPA